MAGRRPQTLQRGAALLIFLILLVMAGLTYVVNSLTPEAIEARRAQKTQEALVLAREALIGYALKHRDAQAAKDVDSSGDDDQAMYGYLPLPDLGSARNQNLDPNCLDGSGNPLEGCDANYFTGTAFDAKGIGPTVVGRFPWRTLGMPPLRDGHGECLWLIVSSLHNRIQRSTPAPDPPPMNWDTLGQLDIVVANGTSTLASTLASAHERPVAVIFAPGPPLPGQDRGISTSDSSDVAQCGGNYNTVNYLDPVSAATLGGVTNYLAGTHGASGDTGDSDPSNDPDDPGDPDLTPPPKSLLTQGKTFVSGGNYLPQSCSGSDCTLVANDVGLPLSSDKLFEAIRNSSNFRTDINTMLDRMTDCLRDDIAAGGSPIPKAIAGFASPPDKSAGRVPDDSCYGDDQPPFGYYRHYNELFFVATPTSGDFTVSEDGIARSCKGVLIFADQRGDAQYRASVAQRNGLANFLEAPNLDSFTGTGTNFAGASQLARVTTAHPKHQDIVRCIPAGGTLGVVESPTLTALGAGQLVAYDAATRTLTLGRENVTTGVLGSENAGGLYGCAWLADAHALGNGARFYFNFRFKKVGTNVGFNGFVFALADANPERNGPSSCGAAGSHLGYSGSNGTTPPVAWPKIGIEFDQGMNRDYLDGRSETSLLKGRNDPCFTCGSGTSNSHAAIVYWGNAALNIADFVNTHPDFDDNVHGFPANPPSRPSPTNPPNGSSGLKNVNLRGYPNNNYDSQLFHVRVELTPTRNIAVTAENSSTSMQTQVWILADSGSTYQIAAMKNTTRPMSQLYPGFAPELQDVATLYDVGADRGGCGNCLAGEACGTDNICYRQALRTLRPGFTGAQRTTDQEVHISDYFSTWIP